MGAHSLISQKSTVITDKKTKMKKALGYVLHHGQIGSHPYVSV
jgi:hypothetical protein